MTRRRVAGIAVLVALVLLVVGRQITLDGSYSSNAAYRAQVDAFLRGELALSDAPEALVHDLAWNEGVHQVWGLGVPAWQTPFELAGRAIGVTPFPDRVPMLVWLALMFYVIVRALWRDDRLWISAGSIVIVALLPGFVTLIRGRVGVYEEAAIYAYAAAVILLGGMLRAETRWRYLALLAGAGLVAFIRPTAGVYGLATAIVASAIYIAKHRRRAIATVAIGGALFVAGGAALYATNVARFGDGLELGHRLNLQSLPGNLYATRFSYPMQRAPLPEAALELGTSFFARPEKKASGWFFQRGLHVGVSDKPRWREYYFTTYTWGYLPVLVAGCVFGIRAWRRRRESDPIDRWLFAWAAIAIVPLLVFYIRAPFLSSRYQLDFAPAFAALLVIAWRGAARWIEPRRHGAQIACGVLGVAWLLSIILAKTATPRSAEPIDRAAAARTTALITDAVRTPRTLPGVYDRSDPWMPTHTDLLETFERCTGARCLRGVRAADSEQWVVTETVDGAVVGTHRPPPVVYLNLFRWNLDTGQMPPATYAFVDDPKFIELEVSTLDGVPAEVQVRVGLVPLALKSTTPSPRGVTLRFEASELPRGLVVAFFAFGPDTELHKLTSRVAVHSIRWR